MDRFRSKLNFWKKVESKKTPAAASPSKKSKGKANAPAAPPPEPSPPPAQTSVAPAAAAAPAQTAPRVAEAQAPPPHEERRSERLGKSYPAKPLPRPGAQAPAPGGQLPPGMRASMPASAASRMAQASGPGARGSVPSVLPQQSQRAQPSGAPPLTQQQRPSGSLPTPPAGGGRVRASMPPIPSQTQQAQQHQPAQNKQVAQQRRQQGPRASMPPGRVAQASSRGQLPQPPPGAGRGQVPSVRGSKPPVRGRQQAQQRGGGRGPLPTPPPGGPAIARGPLPTPPTAAAKAGENVPKAAPVKAQVRAPRPNPQQRPPVDSQRQSVQARPSNPAHARVIQQQQQQRQSMPHMQRPGESSGSSSSRPPSKPQPSLPPSKPQPPIPGGSGAVVKPVVIADVFKQASSENIARDNSNDARKSRRERRGDAGNEEQLLGDIAQMAKAQPKRPMPAPAASSSSSSSSLSSSGSASNSGSGSGSGSGSAVASQSSSAGDDFFIPIATMKKQQEASAARSLAAGEAAEDDRPPTPPPRSPDGDRSHRSQRTAAPKIPPREPAPGEKRQTGFMSRIKSVFGSAPVIPQESAGSSSNAPAAAAAAVTVTAVGGAAVVGSAAAVAVAKPSPAAAVPTLGQLPPTSTSFDTPAAKQEAPKKQSKSSKSSKGTGKSSKQKGKNNKSMSQRAASSMHGIISPRGKTGGGGAAVAAAYGLTEQQQKLKPEKQAEILQQQLSEIDDKITANSRTKEGLQRMAEASATNDPMFEAQLMDLNTMLAQLMEGRSRVAAQLEKCGRFAPRTPMLSPRGGEGESTTQGRARGGGSSGTGGARTLLRAGSSATNLRAKYFKSVGGHAAQHPKQLDMADGDVVTVVWRAPTGWWKVALHGEEGFVNSTYLEVVPDNEGERAVSIQKARQPLPDPVNSPPVTSASLTEEVQPIQRQQQHALAASMPIPPAEKKRTVQPKAVARSSSQADAGNQRRMTMPLPQQPDANGTAAAAATQNGRGRTSTTSSSSEAQASAAAMAVTPEPWRQSQSAKQQQAQALAPKPQRPSYPQAKVIFAFDKSTPTEIGIQAGLQVSVIEVSGEWSYILHEPTTNAGYIPNSYLEYL